MGHFFVSFSWAALSEMLIPTDKFEHLSPVQKKFALTGVCRVSAQRNNYMLQGSGPLSYAKYASPGLTSQDITLSQHCRDCCVSMDGQLASLRCRLPVAFKSLVPRTEQRVASCKDLFVEGHTSTEPGSGRHVTICQLIFAAFGQ